MKVLKPQRLSILQRVVEHRRRYTLVVSGLVYVPLGAARHAGRRLLTEQALWKDVGTELPSGLADEGFPKPCGEVLVSGRAFALGGTAAQAVMARLQVAREGKPLIDKRLAVWGNRYWAGDSPTEAVPFIELPLDWAHAFGGEGFEKNPLGKGTAPIATEHGEVVPLPNVENPKALVTSPKDRPEPAGFGAYDVTWPQRFAKVGKRYDAEWLATRFPGPAEDFDAAFYNAAPADQQLDGFFTGDESLVVEGMHPTDARVEVRLSPLVVRVLVTQRDANGAHFRDVAARLDTIHVLPHLERALLVYRATLPVAEDDADDIEHLILAAEDPAQPKSLEHYRRVLALRLDKERGALASMKDEDLMPPAALGWAAKPDYGDLAEMTRLEHRMLANGERGRKQKLGEAQAKLEAAGFDVAAQFVEPEQPKPPDPYDVDGLIQFMDEMEKKGDAAKAELEAKKVESEASARASFAAAGMDYDKEQKKALDQAGGPPTFSADEQLAMLHDMARIAREGDQPLEALESDLTDPRYDQMLRELEARVRDSYVKFGHFMPAAALPPAERRQMLRALATAAKDSGEPLAGRNLTGADFQGLDLSGMDFSGAMLEGADLTGAELSDANLTGAVLTRALLTGTRLCRANLSGANLGDTVLKNTDLTGARLDETVLQKCELDGAVLHGASLRGTDFLETRFTAVDFSHAEAHQPLFMKADLRSAAFSGAALSEARFLEADVSGVDFTGARLDKAQLIQTKADGASFAGASLAGAVLVHESSAKHASFAGANLAAANLRKTPLTGGDFTEARLDGADVSACDLRGANLHRISARGALAIRTDFRGANLRGADMLGALASKAKLEGADLTGINLSRADLSLAHLDASTRLDEALMLDTRVDPKREEQR